VIEEETTMRRLVFPMAAVFFVAMAGPALAAPGGHGNGNGNGNVNNRGGKEHGLDRADRVAGEHGDRGRDNARTRGNGRGHDATSLQHALKNKGYDPGVIDGRMGRRTSASLADFQKAQGLRVTGRLDADTRTRLGI
jgi:peptidoglycan hydrolase-like protein with peptidoglycan-binding domain